MDNQFNQKSLLFQHRKNGVLNKISFISILSLLLVLTGLLISPKLLFSQKQDLELKWTGNQKCFLESSATVADVDNDGIDEAIIASQEELIAVGKNGSSIWRWKTRKRFLTYPAVLRRIGDVALIYGADNSGQLTCLSGKGKVVWQADLDGGSEWSASVVADLNGDGFFELVQTDMKGTVWIFNAVSGQMIKKAKIQGQPVSPAIGDLNGDGKSEIVIATNDGSITVLDNDLSVLWNYRIGGFSESWSTSAPVIFGASDGKNYIVAASSTGDIFCFDSFGKPVWHYPVNVPVSSTISVGDYNRDGLADLFLVTQTGLIFRFDEKGSLLWKIDMQGRSLAPGAIADINNDGNLEYILSTQQGHIYVLNKNGDVIFDRQLPSRTINVTPSLGNVTGNSQRLDLILTGGESGQTYCFGTLATKKSAVEWSNYRGNCRNTGTWSGLFKSDELRMIPQNLEWNRIYTGDRIQFNIYNPKPGQNPVKASATCILPDGSKSYSIANIHDKEGQLFLPADFILPGIYKFSWTLTSSEGLILLSSSREVALQSFGNDRALAKNSVSSLNATADKIEMVLPLSANALRKEAFEIQSTTTDLAHQQEIVAVSKPFDIQKTLKGTILLNERAKRAVLVSEIMGKASQLGAGTSLVAFEGTKWENRKVDKQLPAIVENPLLLNHKAVPGEHYPVPLVLFNVTDHLLNARVVTKIPNTGIKIKLLRSIDTPTSMGDESWDALPEIDDSGIITIPSLLAREIWIDIEIDEKTSGKQVIEIILQAINGAGVLDAPTNPHDVAAPETNVKITLDVFPFRIASSSSFRLCTWSPSKGSEIEGLLAHGNNVFLLPQPLLKFDDKNELAGFDFTEFDQITDQFKGKEVFFLLSGLPGIKAEFASEAYKKQLVIYFKDLVSHLSNNGIGTDNFALYPFDEPGGNGWKVVNMLVEFGEMVHAVNPDVMLYQDGGGELPMFEAMGKYLDVWCPPIDWIADKTPEMNIMRSTGKLLWSYNCSYGSSRPVGPNIKNINIIYEYRSAALLALRNGVSGIGFWCYNSVNDNMWSRIKLEYNLIYPGTTKSITSRRWEAVREGIEDYRIIAAIKGYLKSGTTIDENVRKSIDHLLNVSLPNLVDPGYQALKFGQSREVFDLVCSDSKMEDFRKEMFACIELIIKK